MRFDPPTKTTTVFAVDIHKSNGLMFDAKGRLDRLRRLRRRHSMARWNVKTGRREVIADQVSGQAIQCLQRSLHRRKGTDLFHRPADYLGTETPKLNAPSIGWRPTGRSSR